MLLQHSTLVCSPGCTCRRNFMLAELSDDHSWTARQHASLISLSKLSNGANITALCCWQPRMLYAASARHADRRCYSPIVNRHCSSMTLSMAKHSCLMAVFRSSSLSHMQAHQLPTSGAASWPTYSIYVIPCACLQLPANVVHSYALQLVHAGQPMGHLQAALLGRPRADPSGWFSLALNGPAAQKNTKHAQHT